MICVLCSGGRQEAVGDLERPEHERQLPPQGYRYRYTVYGTRYTVEGTWRNIKYHGIV